MAGERPPLWVQCPSCQHVTGMLDISLSRRGENHYECDECGHVWTQTPTAPSRPSIVIPKRH
jgi:transposase-like protein